MEQQKVNTTFQEWLKTNGEVFKVIGDHDSGNLSYGFRDPAGARRFAKFAPYTNKTAIGFLENAYEIGSAISHPILTVLLFAVACTDGLALVYEWVDGETLNEITTLTKAGNKLTRNNPDSVYSRFKALPAGEIILVLNQVFDLHRTLEASRYVSCDWYDGCLIYDFPARSLHVMDLDTYHQGAFTNTMGLMYGSERFMAPEEFVKGAVIDYRTTVFHMGATAFELLGTGIKQPAAGFKGNGGLYKVALKATQPQKEQRYASVKDFCADWFAHL